MVSLAATTYLYDRVYLRFMFNRIMPSHDIRMNSLIAGLGFRLGTGDRPVPLTSEEPVDRETTPNEPTLSYGQSTVNTFRSETAAAVQFRHGSFPYLDAAVRWIYGGDPKIIRRNGVAAQSCPVNTFLIGNQHSGVGMGLGTHGYIDRKGHAPAGGEQPDRPGLPGVAVALVGFLGTMEHADRLAPRGDQP